MKFFLLFLINIIFSNSISNWIDTNNHILNSQSYKVSFKQKIIFFLEESNHYDSNNASLIYFNNQIKYESTDKIIIMNQDSLKMLNKYTNQIFIDDLDERYNFKLFSKVTDILKESQFVNSEDDSYYYYKYDNFTTIKIYFLHNRINKFEILHNDITVELSDIKLSILDVKYIPDYFIIGNDSTIVFDLRVK